MHLLFREKIKKKTIFYYFCSSFFFENFLTLTGAFFLFRSSKKVSVSAIDKKKSFVVSSKRFVQNFCLSPKKKLVFLLLKKCQSKKIHEHLLFCKKKSVLSMLTFFIIASVFLFPCFSYLSKKDKKKTVVLRNLEKRSHFHPKKNKFRIILYTHIFFKNHFCFGRTFTLIKEGKKRNYILYFYFAGYTKNKLYLSIGSR